MINRSASHTGGLEPQIYDNHEQEPAAASLYTDRNTSIFLTNTPRLLMPSSPCLEFVFSYITR